jgi:hypothetical protein
VHAFLGAAPIPAIATLAAPVRTRIAREVAEALQAYVDGDGLASVDANVAVAYRQHTSRRLAELGLGAGCYRMADCHPHAPVQGNGYQESGAVLPHLNDRSSSGCAVIKRAAVSKALWPTGCSGFAPGLGSFPDAEKHSSHHREVAELHEEDCRHCQHRFGPVPCGVNAGHQPGAPNRQLCQYPDPGAVGLAPQQPAVDFEAVDLNAVVSDGVGDIDTH